MNIFCTGASGYIGGSVARALVDAGHQLTGLVRSNESADKARSIGVEPLFGSLDDRTVLFEAAQQADLVVNCANSDHEGAIQAFIDALAGTGKKLIHTSGSSIVGTRSEGRRVDDIFNEESAINPSPARQKRVALNRHILSSVERDVHAIIVCPSLIYGLSRGPDPHSMQVPWLIELARKSGVAKHIGSGENIWSNVHIDDLASLFGLALTNAPAGAFYYAENGEDSMLTMCQAISRSLGFGGATQAMSMAEAAGEWGEGPANDTMASNSRVRGVRARKELNWQPDAASLLSEIENGCYSNWAK